MKLNKKLLSLIHSWAMRRVQRPPDETIGGWENPYLLRWYVIQSRVFGIYIHQFLRSDDSRALHDHPWDFISIILSGGYIEKYAPRHLRSIYGDVIYKDPSFFYSAFRAPGDIFCHRAEHAHRVLLFGHQEKVDPFHPPEELPCWSIIIKGPIRRKWGFWCKHSWRFWKDYVEDDPVSGTQGGLIGRGCD